MESVPVLNVESKVDMEVLMMIVMEDTVRLPGLPPQTLTIIPHSFIPIPIFHIVLYLKINSRMVNYPMIVNVKQHYAISS